MSSAELIVLLDTVLTRTGPVGLAGLLLLNSAGLPVPAEIILPLVGISSQTGGLPLALAVPLVVVAQTAGLTLAYAIARHVHIRTIAKYGRYAFINRAQIEYVQALIHRHGSIILIGGLLLPGVHGYLGYAAGVGKVSLPKLLLASFIGNSLWSAGFIGLGVAAGDHLPDIVNVLNAVGPGTLVAVGAVIVGAVWYSKRQGSGVH